jgi:hypothetical protein
MSRNKLAGAMTVTGGVVQAVEFTNTLGLLAGHLVGVDSSGNLTGSAPYIGVIAEISKAGVISIGTRGTFNVSDVSANMGAVVPSSTFIVVSDSFTGHRVNAGKLEEVSLCQVQIN